MKTGFIVSLFLLASAAMANQVQVISDNFPGIPKGTLLDPCSVGWCNATYSMEVTPQAVNDYPGDLFIIPDNGATYYYVDDTGAVQSDVWTPKAKDSNRMAYGNYFKSSSDAQDASNRLKGKLNGKGLAILQ